MPNTQTNKDGTTETVIDYDVLVEFVPGRAGAPTVSGLLMVYGNSRFTH